MEPQMEVSVEPPTESPTEPQIERPTEPLIELQMKAQISRPAAPIQGSPRKQCTEEQAKAQKLLNKVVLSKEDLIKIIDIIEGKRELVDETVLAV
ncbi:MAG: hypothetical protein EZS28_021295 [Streblomastix strix]|uniref:Uncharacterized protein n=1 Tax=Streblomastix strix TaxID=222440 RepID=A0A5J4VKQ1_9EUKA|nr:MAG: hypothetical protein EZS28_021295 [Streblomastix strix]